MDITNKTIKELKELCKELYISGYSNLKKCEIIKLIDDNKKDNDIETTPSERQTKNWRKNQHWYKTGKLNECEIYQKKIIRQTTKEPLYNTSYRINKELNKLQCINNPYINPDGFNFTENFDGLIKKNDYNIFFNLKFVCDSGGSQTRTLKLVYNFIESQFKLLKKTNINKIIFVNILDGSCSNKNKDKFEYLSNIYKNKINSNMLFIIDSYSFKNIYWSKILEMIE